ncbi:MAG: rRNA large subunit methyltransferase I [Candidatus Rokuibacteriota bacterium]|nr:MAG: rRNA large subunit methyltransferase I [Candidatus Rokubacteria bacterium]
MKRGQPALRLKRGREAPHTHPWIFKGDVADVSEVEPGAAVTVIDAASRFVGRGFYNPRPALCCRILTWTDEPLDAAFFRRRVESAVALRSRDNVHGPPTLCRLIWSEADGLPGLVVDRYGPVLVTQCLTLGMARTRPMIIAALAGVFGDAPVFDMDDATSARLEGFSAALGWARGSGPRSVRVTEGGVGFEVTIGVGHKTGLYLDQCENRTRVGALAQGRDVLDAFSYTAGFACHALRGGARRAVCIESSPEAIAGARQNLALNGFEAQAEIRAENAFDELRRLERGGARFGVIVLDPPPFARSRSALDAATRGYKEINLRAMRLLERGGSLLTFSCSHHVSEALFEEICRDAAADAGVRLRVVDRLGQSSDHPVLLSVPETRYLKGLLLEAL